MKKYNYPNDIPRYEHYALLEEDSVFVPGDERSRTNPGHGYPASTTHYITYTVFNDFDEMKNWVEEHVDETFRIIHVKPVSVTKKINFEFSK